MQRFRQGLSPVEYRFSEVTHEGILVQKSALQLIHNVLQIVFPQKVLLQKIQGKAVVVGDILINIGRLTVCSELCDPLQICEVRIV